MAKETKELLEEKSTALAASEAAHQNVVSTSQVETKGLQEQISRASSETQEVKRERDDWKASAEKVTSPMVVRTFPLVGMLGGGLRSATARRRKY